jgi:Signal transduction histidine kinase
MKISLASKFCLTLCVVALCVLVASSIYVVSSVQVLEPFTQTRFDSIFLAEEMRTSSKSLTSNARAFVETGDPIYEEHYWELKDIRNGLLPRPKDARVAPGIKIPVAKLMEQVGLNFNEVRLLHESLALSDQLALQEERAMNMSKGIYQDGAGNYTEKGEANQGRARNLLFGEEYDQYVRQIMLPSYEFDKRLDNRIAAEQKEAERNLHSAIVALVVSVVLVIVSLLVLWLFFSQRIFRPLTRCTAFARQLGQGDYAAKYSGPNLPDRSVFFEMVQSLQNIAKLLKKSSLLAVNEGDVEESGGSEHDLFGEGGEASASQKNEEFEAKTALFDCMSHEIRTPMSAITGLTDLLFTEALTPIQRKHVLDIRNSAMALYKTINDIIDSAKIDASALEFIETDYNHHEIIDAVDSLSRIHAMSKHIEFILEKENTLPICLYGDGERVQQILLTLISNSIKYTDTGYVRFCIAEEESMIRYEIHDTGVTMTDAHLKTLFNPFTSAVERHRKGMESSGLSFYITKKLVEYMGGSIDAKSRGESGTSFYIRLPKKLGNSKALFMEEEGAPLGSRWRGTALVVDDNLVNTEVACALLEYFGLRADAAISGRVAIERAIEKQYDIILMDHLMPDMDGVETTLAIRALGGWCSTVPIVALTANVSPGVRQTLLASSLDDFIGKPLGINILYKALLRWLPDEKRQLAQKE